MTDFDGLAERYRDSVQDSIEFSGQSVEFFSRRKAERVLEITARLLTAPSEMSFLDVGCGVGMTDRFLSGRVGHLVGVDEARLALAAGAGANPRIGTSTCCQREACFVDTDEVTDTTR